MIAKRKIMLFGFVILLFAMMLNFVNGALITPISGPSNSQIIMLNATNGTLSLMLNCSFFAWSSSTANSSSTIQIATSLNGSTYSPAINATWNTTHIEDSNDYSFSAFCVNKTTNVTFTNTGITIDNTIPDTPSSLTPLTFSFTTNGTQTFSATVTNSKTTACNFYLSNVGGGSYTSYDGTYSGSSCAYSKTWSSSSSNGNYYWYILASDGSNSTASITNAFSVNIPARGGGLGGMTESQIKAKTLTVGGFEKNLIKNPLVIILAIIIILIIVVIRKK